MSNEIAYEMEEMMEAMGALALTNSISGIVSIAVYVLTSIALYSIANRRGIHNAWLSWIPVGRLWILGSLADQYQYVAKGQVKNKRKALLTLSLIQLGVSLVVIGISVSSVIKIVGAAINSYSEEQIFEAVFGPLMGVIFLCLPMAGIAIATVIIRYMALYDVYRSCAPENAVMFLVLSIFFKITEPFFLFFNRQKDTGMVKDQPAPAYQAPGYINTPQDQWTETQNPSAEGTQNPAGTEEPWNQNQENQDPWNQGPEQL